MASYLRYEPFSLKINSRASHTLRNSNSCQGSFPPPGPPLSSLVLNLHYFPSNIFTNSSHYFSRLPSHLLSNTLATLEPDCQPFFPNEATLIFSFILSFTPFFKPHKLPNNLFFSHLTHP